MALLLISAWMLGCAWSMDRADGQTRLPDAPVLSDLARKNLEHVAASPAQVEPILRSNPGILLELKSWVAREAANQGRLLTDTDLADAAIFERLRSDSSFRAVATRVLQRYGYLSPELNPDSPSGKQQDYLIKERVKMQLARDEQFPPRQPQPDTQARKPVVCADGDPDCDLAAEPLIPAPATEGNSNDLLVPNTPRNTPVFPDIQRAGLNPRRDAVEQGTDAQQISARMSDAQGFGDAGAGRNSNAPDRALFADGGQAEGLHQLLGREELDAEAVPREESQPVASGFSSPRSYTGSSPSRVVERTPTPVTVRVRNPYSNIPSLYDMYAKAPDPNPSAEPVQFGADIFRRGTGASRRVPMDLPAGPDYVVGPGDTLTINLWGSVSRRFVHEVDREGRLAVPEIGTVMVAGKTLSEAQRAVQEALRSEFRDISADISLSRLRNVRVYVVGDVVRPGAYDVSALSTALNALFVAGGPGANGSLRVVRHYRGDKLLEDVDVYDLILRGVRSRPWPLENGDTILVPPLGPQVTVNGAVRRPAVYELHGEKNLSEVLELAGGILPTASLRNIQVQRLIAHETRTMLSLNVSDKDDAQSLALRLAEFHVEPGDIVQIFPIAPFNPDSVYLQGHVLRPGKYSWRREMKLADLISSWSDLLPEPATAYGEIIRLTPPTYAPAVFSFNLADVLEKPAVSPVLQPLDTVRIFGRYEFEDAPTVTVTGAVRKPGTYRTAGQIHVMDAVHLGGSLTINAQTDDAQVVHHQPDGTIRVMSVNLKRAEAGSPDDNFLLASGDRVLVHEDLNKSDPATVTIQGEIANPGRYPLSAALRVSDLVRIAGGLRRSADNSSADLVHYFLGNEGKTSGPRDTIHLNAALDHSANEDKPLRDGDVLTIRRVPGWSDIGASITLDGEVQHPGTYGFQPGERLSSVIRRAGGFTANAYPYAAVLTRADVKGLEEQTRTDLIRRLQTQEQQLKLQPDNGDADQKKAKDAAIEQIHGTVGNLSANEPLGRVVIRISSRIENWASTQADIQLRTGDKLFIPKQMESVTIIGQVYNPTAVTYRRGKSAEWYLGQAGGPTSLANNKAVFVIRADGSVVGQRGSFWSGNSLRTSLSPGDTVVVPEKAYAGGRNLQNVLLLAQVTSAVSSAAYLLSLSLP
jgi:polysaccharide export outer membrane protein